MKMAALSSSSGSSNVPLDDEYDDIERETTSASTEDADDEQPPERSQVVKKARLRRASFSAAVAEPAWNKIRGRNDGSDARLAGPDGRVGGRQMLKDGTEFFLTLLSESLDGSKVFVAGSVLSLSAWSVLCALFTGWLAELANDGVSWAERWLEHIQECGSAIGLLGTLFVFTLVFRSNQCYDRWCQTHLHWGDMISKCLDLAIMNRRWVAHPALGDKLSRWIIVYAYASKALLRGSSLGATDDVDGPGLVDRGILSREELDALCDSPCWQPYFAIEMIRAVLVEAHKVPGGRGITFDETNKTHGQVFRCFDGVIKEMTALVGGNIRTRSSGLPSSYDLITIMSFYIFFGLASFVWSAGVGWMTPVIVATASFLTVLLIVMGSNLVDPFGLDKVDIPMEEFCETIEAQVHAIDERSRSGRYR
mmetsp:Transcript_12153/g.27729  ORF Transcript_12153/g.27729 Transcript_12153/m.27729 type:complete len:422 (-) Transcript_12153:206-1471(-)